MPEIIEFEIEYVYLSKRGERPKIQHKHYVDVIADNVDHARTIFSTDHAPQLNSDDSFVWITDIIRIPQA